MTAERSQQVFHFNFYSGCINVSMGECMMVVCRLLPMACYVQVQRRNFTNQYVATRVRPGLCSFVGKPQLLLIQQRNLGDFLAKLQEK